MIITRTAAILGDSREAAYNSMATLNSSLQFEGVNAFRSKVRKKIKLAKRYLEQVDSTIALTINKNLTENVKFPKVTKTQTWKSSALPTKATKTTKGMLYRSQLSNVSRTPIHLPTLPQICYQQFCQQKTVHSADENGDMDELIVRHIPIPSYPPNVHLNPRIILPPIQKRTLRQRGGHKNTPHDVHESDGLGNMVVHMKWNDSCKCMRCKLIKSDYALGKKDHYTQWGQYPCVPDAVINREEQDSSDDEQS